MRNLSVFELITLDGYFSGADGDYSWAHDEAPDPEFQAFTDQNASSGGAMVFGRVTYDLMEAFWPTAEAAKQMPIVAKQMNDRPKFVFSRSLDKASWQNTTVLKGDPATEIRKLKSEPGDDLVIMGSGSIVSQLAKEGLIDAYHFVVVPVVIGEGRTVFDDVDRTLDLELTESRAFRNGKVSLRYTTKT
jgi:dihydrofolate reductase